MEKLGPLRRVEVKRANPQPVPSRFLLEFDVAQSPAT
jgi:hypothetical protein